MRLGSREENVRAKLVIFKVSTDGYWDELPFFGTTLNRGGIYVELFSNTAPSGFHNVRFSSLRNEADREISPPPSTLHPVSPAHRGLKAVLTQH